MQTMKKTRSWSGAALVVLLAFSAGACDNFLDVNENPNAPESVGVESTVPGVIAEFGHRILGENLALGWPTEWMQQWSWNAATRGYSNIHHYEQSNIDTNGGINYYATFMNEQRNVMRATEGTEEYHMRGVATFLHGWSFAVLTDAFGALPFNEAFNPSIRDPAYDDQRTIYQGIHALINEGIEDMQRAPTPRTRQLGSSDLLYEGDMSAWVRLAHTVQARLHMRLSNAPGEDQAQRAQAALNALQNGFRSNADDADFAYVGDAGGRQPLWAWRDQGTTNNVASEFMVNLLVEELDDPRQHVYFKPAWDMTVEVAEGETRPQVGYRGHPNGAEGSPDSTWSWHSEQITDEARPFTWISYSEAKFIEAEARLILTGAAAADGPYREGIRANLEKLEVAPAEIDAYLSSLPALTQEANALEAIITQKYIANFMNGEVWNDWRRTGYPRLQQVSNEFLNGIPNRMRVSEREMNFNADRQRATGIPLGLEGMLVPVWWAEQAYPQWMPYQGN